MRFIHSSAPGYTRLRTPGFAPLLVAVLALLPLAARPAGAAGRAAPCQTAAASCAVYASVAGAGVFKSTDFTGHWDGPASLSHDVLALATSTGAGRRSGGTCSAAVPCTITVYAGLSDGLAISRDGGATWQQAGLHAGATAAIAVDPRDASTVLAGTDRGVFRSDDAGATWAPTGVTRTVTALAADLQVRGSFYAGGNGRIWASKDGGRHWSSVGRPLPDRLAIVALAAGSTVTATGTLFAATSMGLWQEIGGTWTRITHGAPARDCTGVSADPSHVFAVTSDDAALYASSDGGATWSRRAIPGLTGGITALLQDPQQPATLLIGDEDGAVLSSVDGGATWSVPAATVAGTVGSPVLAVALAHRPPLPTDGVANPRQAGVTWFPTNGGHTLRGAFLSFWQATPAAASLIGYPLTEEFFDRARSGARAQYFERMELVAQGNGVVPAPLGAELAPTPYTGGNATYAIAAPFQTFWTQNGGVGFFGPAVSPALQQSTGDGTGRLYLVQYFRNARLEYHPEAGRAGATVQVSALGLAALQAKGWLPASGT